MATRGFLTFVAEAREKTTYNEFDSNPEGVGLAVLEWLRTAVNDLETLRGRVAALRVVGSDTAPTRTDIAQLKQYASTWAAPAYNWNTLLFHTQGNPEAILNAGVIEDAHEFPLDSVYAQWGYVIDLDTATFEVYRGSQIDPHDKGRFASRVDRVYLLGGEPNYPVALEASWALTELPGNEDFLASTTRSTPSGSPLPPPPQ